MYKCSMAHSCDPAILTFLDTPVRSPSNSRRCSEVVELQCKAGPHIQAPMESWLALRIDPPRIRPPAKDDSHFSIEEEGEAV